MKHSDIQVDTLDIIDELFLDDEVVAEQILKIKEERNAVILAHNYQRPEVQDIADFIGDSLGLSREAARADADVIVFCGVHFMAETAFILSPDKIILLPDIHAGCPMADMASVEDVARAASKRPDARVVSYVNTSAAVKAVSDYCCTSANAAEVARAVDSDAVLFVPDRNLAAYVASKVDKEIIPWDGFCPAHNDITADHIRSALEEHPGAEVIAHPECVAEVLEIADHVRSTSGMIEAVLESDAEEFVIATESGILYPLSNTVPHKRFYSPAKAPICWNMKLTTLPKVLWALQTLESRVTVPEEIRVMALGAVERMLALG
ncbi:MAG: quinolinate synthase [Candidatus Anoxymicrobium japonicum]|uniref:Quinolinate synthase n=1 Tax=Candidatus Anoxymicrobium japonicum TaxID=2013648 RepID=A0A2N3G7J5_9ACTN|nr:MAG: quinolinate synthase [Candidatus Anoxymicrobium japonicum]